MKLMAIISNNQIPITDIFVVGVKNKKWGQRLVALIKFKEKEINKFQTISLLRKLIKDWQPSKKPVNWYDCPEMSRNIHGKWEINKWRIWIDDNRPID